jgi:hypothetical protein
MPPEAVPLARGIGAPERRARRPGRVDQRPGRRGLGPERDGRGDARPLPARGIGGPKLGQGEWAIHRPGAVGGDGEHEHGRPAVRFLVRDAAIPGRDAHGALALARRSGLLDRRGPIPGPGPPAHRRPAGPIERDLLPRRLLPRPRGRRVREARDRRGDARPPPGRDVGDRPRGPRSEVRTLPSRWKNAREGRGNSRHPGIESGDTFRTSRAPPTPLTYRKTRVPVLGATMTPYLGRSKPRPPKCLYARFCRRACAPGQLLLLNNLAAHHATARTQAALDGPSKPAST